MTRSVLTRKLLGFLSFPVAALALSGCEPVPTVTSSPYYYPYDDALLWGSYYYGYDHDHDNDVTIEFDDLSQAERDAIRNEAANRIESMPPAQRDQIGDNVASRPPNVSAPNHRPNVSRPSGGGNRPSGGNRRSR